MKIVVTGAAGAIGSNLAEHLHGLGHEVIGIDSFTPYYSPELKEINATDLKEKGIHIHRINLAEDDVSPYVSDAHIIIHLAAQPGVSAHTPFEHYINNNIVATHRLLEALKTSQNLKLFIHGSTSSIYGAKAYGDETSEPKPTSYYGVTKLAAEQLAMSYHREHKMPVTVLRFFSVYGERERPEKFWHKLIKAMHEDEEITVFEGSENHIRSFSYIGDIIDGVVLVIENIPKVTGEIFNLGTDQTATTGEGLQIVEELMGKKAKKKILPKRPGDQLETSADINKIRKTLGYNPKTKLRKGLENQVKWYKDKIHDRSRKNKK